MSGSSEKQNQFSCLYLSFYLFTFPLSKSQVDLCSILTSIYHELMGNEEFGIMTRRGLNQSMQHLQHLFWHLVLSFLAIKDSRKTYCPFAERRKFLSSLGESGTLSLVPSSESVFFFFFQYDALYMGSLNYWYHSWQPSYSKLWNGFHMMDSRVVFR